MAKDPYSFKLPENNLSSTVDKIKYKADALDKIKDVDGFFINLFIFMIHFRVIEIIL